MPAETQKKTKPDRKRDILDNLSECSDENETATSSVWPGGIDSSIQEVDGESDDLMDPVKGNNFFQDIDNEIMEAEALHELKAKSK